MSNFWKFTFRPILQHCLNGFLWSLVFRNVHEILHWNIEKKIWKNPESGKKFAPRTIDFTKLKYEIVKCKKKHLILKDLTRTEYRDCEQPDKVQRSRVIIIILLTYIWKFFVLYLDSTRMAYQLKWHLLIVEMFRSYHKVTVIHMTM